MQHLHAAMQHGHTARTCNMETLACSIDMDMHHRHGHPAWTWTCRMDMDMQHGHVHATWTWTCSMEMDMQRRNGHAAWTWTCSMDMDMHHGHGHAAGTWTYTTDLDTRMDRDMLHGHLCSAQTWTCSIDMDILYSIVMDTQHWPRHPASTFTDRRINMDMQHCHEHAAFVIFGFRKAWRFFKVSKFRQIAKFQPNFTKYKTLSCGKIWLCGFYRPPFSRPSCP